MPANILVYLEVLAFFIPVLGFIAWEFYSVNRERRRDAAGSKSRAPGHPHGQHAPHDRVREPIE